MSLLDAWVEFCGPQPTLASLEEVRRRLRGFRGLATLPPEDREDRIQEVLARYACRRPRLIAQLRAEGETTPKLLRKLGTVSATVAEVEDALGAPLPTEARALLEANRVCSAERVIGVLRTSLANLIVSELRRPRHRREVLSSGKADAEAGAQAQPATPAAEEEVAVAAAQAEQRWAARATQEAFAIWRAKGAGTYAKAPALVLADLDLMEQVAAAPDRHSFPDATYRRRCTRLRAAMTDLAGPPAGAPGPLPWPLTRLPEEPKITVLADVFVAEDRLRQREEAGAVRKPPPQRLAGED